MYKISHNPYLAQHKIHIETEIEEDERNSDGKKLVKHLYDKNTREVTVIIQNLNVLNRIPNFLQLKGKNLMIQSIKILLDSHQGNSKFAKFIRKRMMELHLSLIIGFKHRSITGLLLFQKTCFTNLRKCLTSISLL